MARSSPCSPRPSRCARSTWASCAFRRIPMSRDHLASLLAPLGPTRPADELVREINRIYHAIEAATYDTTHPEIFDELPAVWRRMFEHVVLPAGPLTIVDYGCGTGFAASQILDLLGR